MKTNGQEPLARGERARRWPAVVYALVLLALAGSHLMSLVDDAYHEAAYSAVVRVAAIMGEAATDAVTRWSPTSSARRRTESAVQSLRRDNALLRTRFLDLEQRHQALEARHTSMHKVMARRVEAVRGFRSATIARVMRNKVVELGSLSMRAVPYLGIASTIGVVSYELASDCELLEDINAISAEHEMESEDTSTVCGVAVPSPGEVWSQVLNTSSAFMRRVFEMLPREKPPAQLTPVTPVAASAPVPAR